MFLPKEAFYETVENRKIRYKFIVDSMGRNNRYYNGLYDYDVLVFIFDSMAMLYDYFFK